MMMNFSLIFECCFDTFFGILNDLYVFGATAGLLSSFVEVESIKRHFKSRLVGTVLNGYLCLRKLVVQRTKLIDETQDMLLEMLEDMTTGQH